MDLVTGKQQSETKLAIAGHAYTCNQLALHQLAHRQAHAKGIALECELEIILRRFPLSDIRSVH